MSKILSEAVKIDIALTSQSLNGAGTGPYYKLGKYRKALFVWEVGAMAAGVNSVGQVMQAINAAGGGPAKVVANNDATITANTEVMEATVADGGAANGATITINGIVFTKAAATDAANGEFADAAGLETCVNHVTRGVPGVTATNNAGTVTLAVDEPGEKTITVETSDAANITLATVRAIGYIECDASFLDLDDGFDHVALQVTNSVATFTGAVLLRGDARYTPAQAVAAAKADVEP